MKFPLGKFLPVGITKGLTALCLKIRSKGDLKMSEAITQGWIIQDNLNGVLIDRNGVIIPEKVKHIAKRLGKNGYEFPAISERVKQIEKSGIKLFDKRDARIVANELNTDFCMRVKKFASESGLNPCQDTKAGIKGNSPRYSIKPLQISPKKIH